MRKPRTSFASIMTGLVLLASVVVPPLVMRFGASSMAAGLLLVVGLYAFLFAALCALHGPRQILGKIAFIVPVVLIVIYAQGVLSILMSTTFNMGKFWQSYFFLIIYVLGAAFLVFLALRLPKYKADFAVKFVFYVLLLSGLATVLGYRTLGNPQLSDFSVRIRTTHCLSYLFSFTWSCLLVGEKSGSSFFWGF